MWSDIHSPSRNSQWRIRTANVLVPIATYCCATTQRGQKLGLRQQSEASTLNEAHWDLIGKYQHAWKRSNAGQPGKNPGNKKFKKSKNRKKYWKSISTPRSITARSEDSRLFSSQPPRRLRSSR
jgi:hypothetical protein